MESDRLGRRRAPDQGRGLRPLHPRLPDDWVSKAVRVAMSGTDWDRFEALAEACAPMVPTQAQAHGLVLSSLLNSAQVPRAEPKPLDWMDWERRKTLRLLRKSS
jgi:hypothetical protein